MKVSADTAMEKNLAWIGVITLVTSCSTITAMNCCTTTDRTTVSELVTNCESCGLREVPHDVDPRTTELLLNSNALQTIREHDLKEFVNLTVLDLSQNLISSFHPLCFRGLFKLQRLNLYQNKLPAIGYGAFPRGIFKDLTSLRIFIVVFGYDTFEGEYPVDSFLDLRSLEVLSLSALADRIIPPELSMLTKLRVLDFYDGGLTAITRQLIDGIRTSSIESIGFRNMPYLKIIENGAFSNFPSLRAVNLACCSALSHNYVVASLSQTVNTSSVDTVVLDGAAAQGIIGQFRSDNFCTAFWSNVTRLSLRKNNIISVNFDKKWCTRKLSQLILSYNTPLFISPRNPKELDYSQVPQVRVLDFSYLFVSGPLFRDKHCDGVSAVMSHDPNSYFHASLPLSAQNKHRPRKVQKIIEEHNYFPFPPSLEKLYVSYWRTTIRYPPRNSVYSVVGGNRLLYVNMSNSMLVTSLNFTLLGLHNLQIADMSYGILEYISPVFFRELLDLRFLNLSHNSFGTSRTDFRGAFSFLRELEDINLSDNRLPALHASVFANCTKLRNVDLSNNALLNVHLNIANLTYLELLDLSGNQLTTIEEPFLSTLDALRGQADYRLNLTNNPFACKCHPVRFVRWIQTTSVNIIHRENLTCTYNGIESSIVSIPLEEYEEKCRETSAWLQFVIASLCLCLLISVVAVFLVRYHRWYIIYHLTMCTARRKCAADDDEQRRCDAMIVYFAYAVSNAQWVACQWISEWVCTQLLPRAEEQWGLHLYVSDRDDTLGASKTETFLYGFGISDKVIVCLTQILCNDAQFGNHLNLALASKKALSNYIFIIFDDAHLKTHNRVLQRLLEPDSPSVRLRWVDCGTTSEQDKFWRKLRYALIKDDKHFCQGTAL